LIPSQYSVPPKIFGHLTVEDQQGIRDSDTNFSSCTFSSCCDSNVKDEIKQSGTSEPKSSNWEVFYRELIDLVAKRKVNIRTT
jgi:hypothetical protein